MSYAYTAVSNYGEQIHVHCETCNYTEPFDLIKQANAAARAHNASQHGPEEH